MRLVLSPVTQVPRVESITGPTAVPTQPVDQATTISEELSETVSLWRDPIQLLRNKLGAKAMYHDAYVPEIRLENMRFLSINLE